MWAYEKLYPDIETGIEGELLFEKKTPYQDLKIYQTSILGRVLFLDGTIQTTEKDEFIYHEMLTHPLLLAHPNPEKVLIIGAGDGGVLREVLKHDIKKAVLVEIDEDVITFSKKYLPSICAGAFEDKRVETIIDDGAKFAAESKEKFDVIIVDSPDPVGVAKVLFSIKFYKDIYNCLTEDGMMIRQTGSTMFQPRELPENYTIVKNIFPIVIPQIAAIPTYVGGFFSFIIGSKKVNFKTIAYNIIEEKYNKLNLNTKYYNPDIHFAGVILPNYIKKGLY